MTEVVAAAQALAEAAASLARQAHPRPVTVRLTFRDHQDVTGYLRDMLRHMAPLRDWADSLLAGEAGSARLAVQHLAAAAEAAEQAHAGAAEAAVAVRRAASDDPQAHRSHPRPLVTAARVAAAAAEGIGGSYRSLTIWEHLAYAAHLSRALGQVALAFGHEATLVGGLCAGTPWPVTRYDDHLCAAGREVRAACQAAAPVAAGLAAGSRVNP